MIRIHRKDITELLRYLDAYAANVNAFEYGLPLHDDRLVAMENIVAKWLRKQMTVEIDSSEDTDGSD